jgi:FkbM family methyltransferase
VTASLLRWFEAGGGALRHVGLGSIVERAGPFLGGIAARRPATVNGLRRRNELDACVVVVEVAAGAVPARASLYLRGGGNTSSLVDAPGSRGVIDVAVKPIDDVLGDEPVDVVKLDVEGGEADVLHGMKRLLHRRRDLTLIVECNPSLLAAMSSSRHELLAILAAEGFSVWQVDEEAGRLSRRIDVSSREYVNLVCARGRPRDRLPGR